MQRLARAMFWQKNKNRDVAKKAYSLLTKAKEIDKRNAEKNHTAEKLLPAAAIIAQFFDDYEKQPSRAQELYEKSKPGTGK
jgi:hypothetical protein